MQPAGGFTTWLNYHSAPRPRGVSPTPSTKIPPHDHVHERPLHMSRCPFTCTSCSQLIFLDQSIESADNDAWKNLLDNKYCPLGPTGIPPAEEAVKSLNLPPSVQDTFLRRAAHDSPGHAHEGQGADMYVKQFSLLDAATCDGKSDVRYPLCQACARAILQSMEERRLRLDQDHKTLSLLERELQRLAIIKGDLDMSDDDMARWRREHDRLEHDVDAVHNACKETCAKIRKTDIEAEQVRYALETLSDMEAKMAKEEQELWYVYHDKAMELEHCASSKACLDAEFVHMQKQLASLEQSCAYRDVFCIEQDAYGIGTINGLRLGRHTGTRARPNEQVPWSEINAAWGQTALLLTVLQRKLNYASRVYKVVARGSFSVVERLEPDHAVFELYATSEWQLGRLFHARRFDCAMLGFLTCVQEIYMHAKSLYNDLEIPYP